ncbi:unnamed protein product [Rotaria socialis]|uniref:C2H2-type domain-containing protein n=1 Tax=Rotaria socialis TaxID=392032 RepID=A0A818C950_9BILA|nr:unnamed protein product [Rotaria socialis]CAF4503228.1 unnamed protein product [Rotaria socialis]
MARVNFCLVNDDECGGDKNGSLICLADINKKINKSQFPKTRTIAEAILYRADIEDESKVDLNKTFICDNHFSRLFAQFSPKKHKRCYTCNTLSGLSPPSTKRLRQISRKYAQRIHSNFDLKHSYGEFMCELCRKDYDEYKAVFLSKRVSRFIERRKNQQKPTTDSLTMNTDNDDVINNSTSDEDSNTNSYADTDEDFLPGDDKESTTTLRKALDHLLDLCGNKYRTWVTQDYQALVGQTRLNYLCRGRSIIRTVMNIMAPNDANQLEIDLFDHQGDKNVVKLDGHFLSVMQGVTEAYNNAESWTTRREILSIIAPKINLKLIQSFIPGLTLGRFTAARRHTTEFGYGASIDKSPVMVQRFDYDQVEHFIDFITSEHVCTDLPFGEKCLKQSNGEELYVPNTIRNMIPTRIIQQYYIYCQESSLGFCPLGRSSLYSLLDVCKASTRKSLQGINYFAADAGEAFDSIEELISELHLDITKHRRVLENLKRGRQYLKSDYKVHVTKSSTIADHCATFALSDKLDKDFQQMCDHEHNDTCDECDILQPTFDEIKHDIGNSTADTQLSARLLAKFMSHEEAINVWKSHLLRAINQDLCREEILSTLADDSVYIHMDWAMKWLPEKYREGQSNFYGKRGLSWHISVVARKNEQSAKDPDETISEENSVEDENTYSYLIIVHVFDHCIQDSEAVIAILRDVLLRIKQVDDTVKDAYIRSDNAGCYHSAQTIFSLPLISNESKIRIRRIDFCDPQGGKGPCDRYAAVIKSHVRRFLDEKHNVTTAAEFVEAIYSNEGVQGVCAYEARLDQLILGPPSQLAKISLFHNFSFEPHGVRVHRSWKVGDGKFLPFSKIEPPDNISTILCSDTPKHKAVSFTKTQSKKKQHYSSKQSTDIPNNTFVSRLFDCYEEGCIKKFLNPGNLVSHLVVGKHQRLPERTSLRDTGMQIYASKLERVGQRELVSVALQNTTTTANRHAIRQNLSNGWALPKIRKVTRLTPKQLEYLTNKFNDGIKNNIRWKPETVAAEMECLKEKGAFVFAEKEFLKASQIRSYFSRLKSNRQKLNVEDFIDEDAERIQRRASYR